MSHPDVQFKYLSGADIAALEFSNQEILDAIDAQIIEQGEGKTVIEPRMHLRPKDVDGHFNVLRGAIGEFAGVKVVGDYVNNYKLDLPSEMAFVLLFDPATGMPKAILDGTAITDMRTGALTALGGKYLARKDSRVLGNIGARGSSYWNVRLLDHLFDFDEIRVHSRRSESRTAFGARLEADLGKKVTVTDNWRDCLFGADISAVGSLIQLVTNGIRLGSYRPDDTDDEVEIRVRFPAGERSIDQIDRLRIPSERGAVPLSNFVTRLARP